ncbi:MAG: hypothetical protein M3Y22_17325 [Pseudomonadota bacterium]|nr:hypothetical protein [Pseudomonadota bacterium]
MPGAAFLIMMPWGRVGSNLLFNSIGQAAGLAPRRFVNENFNLLREPSEQLSWLRAFYTSINNPPLVGCKQNILSVGDRLALSALLAELAVPLIRLRRSNILKVAVSQLRAEIYAERSRVLTGVAVWGVRTDSEPMGPTVLNADRFLQVATRARQADAMLAEFSPDTPTLDVEYAQMCAGVDKVTEQVCEWLGLAVSRKTRPYFTKATPDDLASAVPNLADLRRALARSPLAELDGMFDE